MSGDLNVTLDKLGEISFPDRDCSLMSGDLNITFSYESEQFMTKFVVNAH